MERPEAITYSADEETMDLKRKQSTKTVILDSYHTRSHTYAYNFLVYHIFVRMSVDPALNNSETSKIPQYNTSLISEMLIDIP
ncbi:Hypothetical predicted protein [Octopus vulgaris]|uniref:Uncharacterized protein n=1 Tax=Octopus vulgaris TaxID=6645 RepID=A0AA36FEN1_OCTVU|nr:Hypothetical predicted protein [Octopus vulgaris]